MGQLTPMFPLESVLLPGDVLPLRVFEPRYSALVADCLASADRSFGVVLIERGREVGGGDARCDIGALARIADYQELGGGQYALQCLIGERVRVARWLPDDPYPRADIEAWPDEPDDAGTVVTGGDLVDLEDRIYALFERIAEAKDARLPPKARLLGEVEPGEDAGNRLYALASRVPIGAADRYAVLAASSPSGRLTALTEAVDTVAALIEFQLAPGDDAGEGRAP